MFPDDVLPLPIAETDFALAPAVASALREAIELSDTGYASAIPDLGDALSEFAAQRWGWEIDPTAVTAAIDVGVGVVEVLRVVAGGGGTIVISPPVYPPFYAWIAEVGGRLREAPLARHEHGWRLDLNALEEAFADRPAAYVLCNPHNPVGLVHDPGELEALVALARKYDVVVVSDEIHAPLVLPGAHHTPLLTIAGAKDIAVSVVSASKAWNLAGLKCATVVTASAQMAEVVDRFPVDTKWRVGHLGVIATIAAYRDGGDWLDRLIVSLDARRRQLGALIDTRLPGVSWVPPQATYLAWLDCSALETDDAHKMFLDRGRVALDAGSKFGSAGAQHVRLNFGTSAEILDEAVARMQRGIRA
jgi:cystathionine beta-lyase